MGGPLTKWCGSVAMLLVAATGVAPASWRASSASPPGDRPPACTVDSIAGDTGIALLPTLACSAGFAMALAEPVPAVTPSPQPGNGSSTTSPPPVPCQQLSGCAAVDVFHMTLSGWVHDGRHSATCAEDLDVAFMSPQTAATFAPVCDDDAWTQPATVRPHDEGLAVMYVQIALLALGVEVAVDGTYDSVMENDVRRLQTAYGLEPTGIVGSETHALLGTGPMVPGVPSPTTTSSTTSPSTTSPSTTSPSTTSPSTTSTTVAAPSGMAPGTSRACTAAAVSTDVGRNVAALSDCHAGWALGLLSTTCPPTPDDPDAECETVDAFHVESGGWVHSGAFYAYCAEVLADGAGMSIHTALRWSPVCGDSQVSDRVNIAPGERGQPVTQLQIALVALGYPIQVDGEFGARTEAAVRDVQYRNGLAVDGIADPDTQVAVGM